MSSKALLALLLLAGCPPQTGDDCEVDLECDDTEVCARDHHCTSPSNVREVTVTWTVRGGPANAQSCAPHPDLELTFLGDHFEDSVGFTPVPCSIGQFFVDKLPLRFTEVQIGFSQIRAIDASGRAMFDLP